MASSVNQVNYSTIPIMDPIILAKARFAQQPKGNAIAQTIDELAKRMTEKNAEFYYCKTESDRPKITVSEMLPSKGLTLLVSFVHAYTPTCSNVHLPSITQSLGFPFELKVDNVAFLAINSCSVLYAYKNMLMQEKSNLNYEGKQIVGKISMIADIDGKLTEQLGLLDDYNPKYGLVAKRALILYDKGKEVRRFVEDSPASCNVTNGSFAASLVNEYVESQKNQ